MSPACDVGVSTRPSLLCITVCSNGDMAGILKPIHRGIFEFCGYSVLAPQVAYAAAHGDDDYRAPMMKSWVDRLATIADEEPITVGRYA